MGIQVFSSSVGFVGFCFFWVSRLVNYCTSFDQSLPFEVLRLVFLCLSANKNDNMNLGIFKLSNSQDARSVAFFLHPSFVAPGNGCIMLMMPYISLITGALFQVTLMKQSKDFSGLKGKKHVVFFVEQSFSMVGGIEDRKRILSWSQVMLIFFFGAWRCFSPKTQLVLTRCAKKLVAKGVIILTHGLLNW